jgi:hypothetical protein
VARAWAGVMTDYISPHLKCEFYGEAAEIHLKGLQDCTWSLIRDVLAARNPNADSDIRANSDLLNHQVAVLKNSIRANIDAAQRHGSATSIEYVRHVTIMLNALEAL